ncbi:eukaryotic rRNA processing [Pholiota molesta]|nr:eukaryotic rRNA processing [Pholiota molesta]
MARLMKLLGDDGLDDIGQAQLDALAGEGEGSGSEGEEDGEEEEGEGAEEDEDSEVEAQNGDEANDSDAEDVDMGEDEDEEAIPLDEAESVDEDAVPRQKVEIDNKVALEQIRESIKLDASLPWTETLVLSYPHTIDVDVDDDLNRELAFYKQALHSANEARTKAAKLNFPFTRPADYFAEMIKSDAHMERIRIRLLDESAGIKKSELKRKEREGKKFGKQIQVEKIKEREKSKKEMEERLKGLKRKRKDVLDNPHGGGDDDFDIQVEDAIADRPAKRGRASNGRGIPRDARDKKYGFGGATRHSKSNTRESTDDFGPGGSRGGGRGGRGGEARGGSKRLGKSRRMASK